MFNFIIKIGQWNEAKQRISRSECKTNQKNQTFAEENRRRRCDWGEKGENSEEGEARKANRRRKRVAQGKEIDKKKGKNEKLWIKERKNNKKKCVQDRDEPAPAEKRRKDEEKPVKISHHNGEEDERTRRHVRMNDVRKLRNQILFRFNFFKFVHRKSTSAMIVTIVTKATIRNQEQDETLIRAENPSTFLFHFKFSAPRQRFLWALPEISI